MCLQQLCYLFRSISSACKNIVTFSGLSAKCYVNFVTSSGVYTKCTITPLLVQEHVLSSLPFVTYSGISAECLTATLIFIQEYQPSSLTLLLV